MKKSNIEILDEEIQLGIEMAVPYADEGITAGFPSPAQDYMLGAIDLNSVVIKHRETTFYARVVGDSMVGAGIFDGDLVVVDRSVEPTDGDIVVAYLEGEFTIKTYSVDPSGGCVWLVPANRRYKRIQITPDHDFMVWGVVTHSVRKLK